jgi:hypothetical protein
MKRISYLFFLSFLTSILASSCSSTETYAELLTTEKSLIQGYINRNNILVVSAFPVDTPWATKGKAAWVKDGRDVYVLLSDGLYFHKVSPGVSETPSDTLVLGNTIVPRFKKYTLGVPADSVSNWNTVDYPYPPDFVYGDASSSNSCTAFQITAYYMKRNYSEAKIIVPSKIGFNADMLSVTPLGFDIKIQILKE